MVFLFSLNFIEFKFLKRTVIYIVYVLFMSEMKIEKAAAVVDILLTVISPMHIFSVLYINYGGTHIHIYSTTTWHAIYMVGICNGNVLLQKRTRTCFYFRVVYIYIEKKSRHHTYIYVTQYINFVYILTVHAAG